MAEKETGLKQLSNNVLQRGDPSDAYRNLDRNTGRIARTVAVSQGTVLAAEALSSEIGAQYLLTYPMYSAFTATVVGMLYGIGRYREKGNAVAAEQTQKEVRELLGEPVDVIRTKEGRIGKRRDSTLLRWHGLDNLPKDAAQFTLAQ